MTLPHVYAIVSGVLGMLGTPVCYSWKDGQVITEDRSMVCGYMLVLPTSYLLQPEQNSTWGWAVETKDSFFLLGMACC